MNDDQLNDMTDLPGAPDGDGMFSDLGHFATGAIPIDAVLRQGRAIRTRRRVVGGGVLAAAAALTIGVPVAIAGAGGSGTGPASGHSITVDQATENRAQQISFSGSVDGERWSLTLRSHCETSGNGSADACLGRRVMAGNGPVTGLVAEPWHGYSDFFQAVFGPHTDYAIIKLDTGGQVTVPAFATDDGYRVGYYRLPHDAKVKQVLAFGKDGQEIGRTTALDNPVGLDSLEAWTRPDGQKIDVSVPAVHIADGRADGAEWSVDVTLNPYRPCFASRFGAHTAEECPDFGARVDQNGTLGGVERSTFVIGEVDPKTTRVDVTYKDGTVQHLTPVRSQGHAFVGTYVPRNATVTTITPVTGTNS